MDLKNIRDGDFDALYPVKMKKLSGIHWTPVDISKRTIAFLGEESGNSVLDLGSGVGKFCIIAAACSEAKITGVEQRGNLIQISRKIASTYQLQRLDFIHDDLINIDFRKYQAFYFFNAFEENINLSNKLDRHNGYSPATYLSYTKLIHEKFEEASKGTRIATYCGITAEIPESYTLVKSSNKGKLKFWQKMG